MVETFDAMEYERRKMAEAARTKKKAFSDLEPKEAEKRTTIKQKLESTKKLSRFQKMRASMASARLSTEESRFGKGAIKTGKVAYKVGRAGWKASVYTGKKVAAGTRRTIEAGIGTEKEQKRFQKQTYAAGGKVMSRFAAMQRKPSRQRIVYRQPIQQNGNKFMEMLARRRAIYDRFEASRQRNALPKGYAQMVDDAKQLDVAKRREFGRQNSLLKAHENMAKVNLDFSSGTESSILTAENIFSADNPNSNVFKKSGRPNILQNADSPIRTKHRLKIF